MTEKLTRERLAELLHYDAESGVFTRKVGRSGPNARAGDIAGCDNGQGYIRIYVDGRPYKGHQLAWFYTHGLWADEIDHINGNRADNRLDNLRSVTRAQNKMNCATYKSNSSGIKGVSFFRPTGKWKAQIQRDGKKIGLGYFVTKEEAGEAYRRAADAMFGEFARAA